MKTIASQIVFMIKIAEMTTLSSDRDCFTEEVEKSHQINFDKLHFIFVIKVCGYITNDMNACNLLLNSYDVIPRASVCDLEEALMSFSHVKRR